MHQIRIHGRGGQGVVTTAELIAIAAFKSGYIAQAFPSFGVERTGAPIESFARISHRPIRTREHIYHPDIIIIQDATVTQNTDVTYGCGDRTVAIVNTTQDKKDLKIKLPAENIHTVDATKIALEVLGKNIANTVMLGAFAKISGLVSLEALKTAILEKFGEGELTTKNIKAAQRAYQESIK